MIPSYLSRLTTNFSKISTIGCKNYHDQTDEPTGPKVITDLPGPKSKALQKNVKFQKVKKSDIFGNYEDSVGNYLVDADGNTFLDINLQDDRVPFGYNYKNLEKVLFASNKRIDEIKMGVFPGMRFPTRTAQSFQEVSPNMPSLYLCPNETVALRESMKTMKYSSEKHDSEVKSQRLFGSIFNRKATKYSLLCFKDAQSLAPSNEDLSRVDYPMYKYPLNENVEYNNSQDEKSLAMIEEQICVCQEKDRPVAGIIIEPLQSTTNQVLSTKFMLKLEEIACKNGIYLMFDEIKTCCGATGRFWMHEHYPLHCQPDILSFGGKMQISGFFHRSDLFPFYTNNNLLTTESISLSKLILFENIVDLIGKHNLMKNARVTGDYIKNNLLHMEKEYENLIKATRGLGTILAFDTSSPRMAEDFLNRLRQKGILCGKCGPSGIAIRPSLTFTKNHAVIFIDRLLDVIKHTALKPIENEQAVPVLPKHDEKAVLDTIIKPGNVPPTITQTEMLLDGSKKSAEASVGLKQIDTNQKELELLDQINRDSAKMPPSLSLISEAQKEMENVQTKKDESNLSITIKLPKSLGKAKKPPAKDKGCGQVSGDSIKKQKLDIEYPKKPSGQSCKSMDPPNASSAPMQAMPKAPSKSSPCGKTAKDKCEPSAKSFKIQCFNCKKKGSGKCKPGKDSIKIKCMKCMQKGGGQCKPGKNAIKITCTKCKMNESKGCQPGQGAITTVCAECKKEQKSKCNDQSRKLSYLVYQNRFHHTKRFYSQTYSTESTTGLTKFPTILKKSSKAEKKAEGNCATRHRSYVRNKYKLNKLDIDHYKISGRKFFGLIKSKMLLKRESKAILCQQRNRDTDAIYDDKNEADKKEEKKDEKKDDDKSSNVKPLALKWIKKRPLKEEPKLEVLYSKEVNQISDKKKGEEKKPPKEIKTPEVKKEEPVKVKETLNIPNEEFKDLDQKDTKKVLIVKGPKKVSVKEPSIKIKKEARVSGITSSSLDDTSTEENLDLFVEPLVKTKIEETEAKQLRKLNLEGGKQTNQNQSDLLNKWPVKKANEKGQEVEIQNTKKDDAKTKVTKKDPNQLIEKPIILTDAPQVSEEELETKKIIKAKQAFNEGIEAVFKAKPLPSKPIPSKDQKKQKGKKGGDKGKKKVQIKTKKKVAEKCKKGGKKAKKGKGGGGPCAPQTCPKVMELVFFMKSRKGKLCPKTCDTKKARTKYQVLKSKRKCKGSWQTDCF